MWGRVDEGSGVGPAFPPKMPLVKTELLFNYVSGVPDFGK